MTADSQNEMSGGREEGLFWEKPATNRALWVIQGLLAGLFLFTGGMKLVLPVEAMTGKIHLPGMFLRFIGIAESLGALGLILPWLLGIRRELTPVAAAGLVIIMIGATVVTLANGSGAAALFPFLVGVLLLVVAYGRWSSCRAASLRYCRSRRS